MSLFASSSKYLIFSSIGDSNRVDRWMSHASDRLFDLVVYYYGDDPNFHAEADLLIKRKGFKYENFCQLIEDHDVSRYQAIWVVDDDIVLNTYEINRMFSVFTKYDLLLAQPSYCPESRINWPITKNDPDCEIRYTNFVENGVAIFSNDVLEVLKPTFKEARTGWGIDLIWPMLMGFPTRKIAVIDDVCCSHPWDAPSSLDRVLPRHLHRFFGIELLKRYGIVPKDLPTSAHWNEVSQNLAYEVKVLGRIESNH